MFIKKIYVDILVHKLIIIYFFFLLCLIKYFKESNKKQIIYIYNKKSDVQSNKKTFLYKEDKNISNLNNKKSINILLSIDNSYVYPNLVTMTSCLENNDKENHIIIFYLRISSDFDDKNIEIFY